MNSRILNKDFQHPADGWYQIEALGNHPNRAAGVVQVIDAQAAAAIVERFNADAAASALRHGNEMLIDHEHFSDQADQETRAYGWLQELQNRSNLDVAPGIYGRVRWTGTGKAAVDGGDYRFFSTEYDPSDLVAVDVNPRLTNGDKPGEKSAMNSRSLPQMRPTRLGGLTLTNMNNNRGQKPITNRAERESEISNLKSEIGNRAKCAHLNEDGTFKGGFDGCVLHMQTCEGHSAESARKICGKIAQEVMNRAMETHGQDARATTTIFAGSGESVEETTKNRQQTKMKDIAKLLGLPEDTAPDAVSAAIARLKNRVADVEAENQTLLGEQLDSLLAGHNITDEKVSNRLKPVLQTLKNREERLACLADFGFKAGGKETHGQDARATTGRVLNRGTGEKVSSGLTSAATDEDRVEKIKNRCAELQGKGVKFEHAWNQAVREITPRS
jgi:polyhydroxyalkanoate synthesis regulator phasin